jgi:hypothetical protein
VRSKNVSSADSNVYQNGTKLIQLVEGQYYAIRFRQGENCGWYQAFLNITDEYGNIYNSNNPTPVFFTSSASTYIPNALTTRDVYYALEENTSEDTANNLFNCYITDNTDPAFFEEIADTKRRTDGINILWTAITNNYISKNATSVQITKDGKLVLCDSTNNPTYTIYPKGNASNYTPINYVRITDAGELEVGNTTNTFREVITSIEDTESTVNAFWKDQYDKYSAKSINASAMIYPNILSRQTDSTNELNFVRYSSNGKYAFIMDAIGNCLVLGNQLVCNNQTIDGTHIYTKSTKGVGDNFYAYKVASDKKMNKLFLADEKTKNISYIPVNKRASKNYTEYPGYSPYANISSSNKDLDSPENCRAKCSKDENCHYYYTYTDTQQKNYCLMSNADSNYDSINMLPSVFTPLQPNSGIKKSNLFVKDIINTVDTTQYVNLIPNNKTTEHTALSDYVVQYTADDEVKSLDAALGTIQASTKEQEDIWNSTENFQDHGFVNKNIKIDSDAPNSKQDIFDKQINPMIDIAKDYEETISKMNQNYHEIDNKMHEITNADKKGIRDILLQNRVYDYSGNLFNYKDDRPELLDAVVEDSSSLVYYQNSSYILATMTLATAVIVAIILAKE